MVRCSRLRRRPGRAAASGVVLTIVALGGAAVGARGPAPAPAGAQATLPQAVPALRAYRWTQRVLVLLAPDDGRPGADVYRSQQREFARAAPALRARDVTVLDVRAAGAGNGAEAGADAGRARVLRRQLGVADGAFAVVLVGKDGGVKLRRRTLVRADVVLALVDAMPMGAAEARRRGSRGAP